MAGVPQQIKTDNGPAYLSTKVTAFLQLWGITHVTGIPHSPTGQGIVEHAHGTLKHVLQKQKGGMMGEGLEARLNKATYVLNFLQVTDDVQQPPMLHHFGSLTSISGVTPRVKVQIQDLQTGQWSAPCDLLTWGRGYACVSTDTGPRWVPARLVKPYLEVSSPAAVSSE